MEAKNVTVSNRDVWESVEAMVGLVSRGWPDARLALRLAGNFRSLRDARDRIEEARTSLLREFAVKAEDGGYAKDADGTVRLSDPAAFNEEWRALLGETAELKLYPVKLSALAGRNGKKRKQKEEGSGPLGNMSALQLEVLLHIGVLEDDLGVTTEGD